jgi:shikimate 5-dehydrogenase
MDSVEDSIAVNTVKIINNTLIGYNCDLIGLKEHLLSTPPDAKINLLGDGAMANNIKSFLQVTQYSRKLGNWDQRHTTCDLLINTTSLDCPVDDINAHTVVDCVIKNTLLVKKAISKNLHIVTGMDLYKSQLSHQFKIYTGIVLDRDYLNRISEEVIRGL